MTELEQLITEVFDTELTHEEYWGNYPNTNQTKIKKILPILEQKYSVSIRNNDSSADNNKVEHYINQEQMRSQIKAIAIDLGNSITNYYTSKFTSGTRIELPVQNSLAFEHFQQELKDCFAMHFKVDSKPSNDSVEQLHSDEELTSKIKSIAYEIDRCESRDVYWTDYLVEETIKLIKTYQNYVLRPVKD